MRAQVLLAASCYSNYQYPASYETVRGVQVLSGPDTAAPKTRMSAVSHPYHRLRSKTCVCNEDDHFLHIGHTSLNVLRCQVVMHPWWY